jgi:8-oxo-dGTP pyrophosphatase MutT (NUDIX family)
MVMPPENRPVTVDHDVEIPVPPVGEVWTVGAVIVNQRGEAFAKKRGTDRRLFPNTWDIVGGHVEPRGALAGCARSRNRGRGARPDRR